jgi:hypothetical protein
MATRVSILSVSYAVATFELEELMRFAERDAAAERALVELYIEKGADVITFHKALSSKPFHIEAVLCQEARALLQAWRVA